MKQETDIERLFKSHYEKMYNLARCILYDDDESKDIVSEIFTKILDGHIILLPGQEKAYLMQSVRNRCLNIIAHKNTKEKVVNLLSENNVDFLLDDNNERLEQLMQVIDKLTPPIRKRILQLHYLEEMSYQDIAKKRRYKQSYSLQPPLSGNRLYS